MEKPKRYVWFSSTSETTKLKQEVDNLNILITNKNIENIIKILPNKETQVQRWGFEKQNSTRLQQILLKLFQKLET